MDGRAIDTRILEPGVHMLTASAPDDPAVARVARWLPMLRADAPDSPKAVDYPRYFDNAGENARGPHAVQVLSARGEFTP